MNGKKNAVAVTADEIQINCNAFLVNENCDKVKTSPTDVTHNMKQL